METEIIERVEPAFFPPWPAQGGKLAKGLIDFAQGAADPSSIGIPGYTSLREPQKQFLRFIASPASAQRRISAANMPTGSGKSLAYVTLARLAQLIEPGTRAAIITGSRQLQDQLKRDFKRPSRDIRGKANYLCLHDFDKEDARVGGGIDTGEAGAGHQVHMDFSGYIAAMGDRPMTVEHAPCNFEKGWQCPTKESGGCTYYRAIMNARQGGVVVTNYAWWLANDKDQAGKFDLLIVDEAHNMESLICGSLTAEWSLGEIKKLLNISPPRDESYEEVAEWLQRAVERAREREANGPKSDRARVGRLKGEMEKTLRHHSQDWVRILEAPRERPGWGMVGARLKIAPVSAAPYVGLIFREVPKIVLVSATITQTTLDILGLDRKAYSYLNVASTFKANRRPFYVLPGARMSGKMTDEARRDATKVMAERIAEIARLRPGLRGLVQTVSYARAEEIVWRLEKLGLAARGDYRIVTHGSGGLRGAVEEFKGIGKGKGAMLISPSAQEGVDLPYDLCRWQAIAKIPFPDNRDPLNKAKGERFKGYNFHLVGVSITQMYGRLMRTESDWGETFMLDDAWAWVRREVGNSAPRELWEAERMVDSIPPPPRF